MFLPTPIKTNPSAIEKPSAFDDRPMHESCPGHSYEQSLAKHAKHDEKQQQTDERLRNSG
jgi:hypothetical protein